MASDLPYRDLDKLMAAFPGAAEFEFVLHEGTKFDLEVQVSFPDATHSTVSYVNVHLTEMPLDTEALIHDLKQASDMLAAGVTSESEMNRVNRIELDHLEATIKDADAAFDWDDEP